MAPANLKSVFLPALIYALVRSRNEYELKETEAENVYDYVIVGSGWGGSVLAKRLSKDPRVKVLVLEAGGKDNVTSEIPMFTLGLHGGGYDWQYKSVPQQRACWGNPGKMCAIPSGKVVGGSSVLDVLVYARGSRDDFDRLGRAVPGWSYQDVLPYYKKFEDFHGPDGKCVEDDLHHCGGEVYIGPSAPNSVGETTEYFIDAAKELLGLQETERYNEEPGLQRGLYFMKQGVRWGAGAAYLKPTSQLRDNLHVSLNSFVLRVLIDPSTKTATGVAYEKNGEVKHVAATKSVILSAGVYQSPKLLMVSGIGPKYQLEKHNVPVMADLPGVGHNYQEMVSVPIVLTTGNTMSQKTVNIINSSKIRKWAQGTDLLTSPTGLDAIGTLRTSLADTDIAGPDVGLVYQSLPLMTFTAPFLQRSLGFSDEYWNQLLEPLVNKEIGNIQVNLLRPKSRGIVSLKSSDPKDYPIIDPKYYSVEHDFKTLIEAVRTCEGFANTTSFSKLGYKRSPYTFEECKHIPDRLSDEYIGCFLKYGTLLRWCGVGTNRMGSESDAMSVVDERLRVRGVSNLRVVDASILPTHMGAPPAATVIMVAEKAADMILQDHP